LTTGAQRTRGSSPVQTPFPYLCLGNDLETRDALDEIGDVLFSFMGRRAASLASANSIVKAYGVVTSVALLADPWLAGGSLSALFPLQSLLFPPLAALTRRVLTAEELDSLRTQGVAHVFDLPLRADRDVPVLQLLSRSHSWMTSSLDRMPLPDVLQTMAAHSQSGMLLVTAPSMPSLSAKVWSRLDEVSPCGRLYVREGRLIFAETPSSSGPDALAAMLRIQSGVIRMHEVFLSPATENIKGSLQSNLIHAACRNDEGALPGSVGESLLPSPTTWRPSEPIDRQSSTESQVDIGFSLPPADPAPAIALPSATRAGGPGSTPIRHDGSARPSRLAALRPSPPEREREIAMSDLDSLLKQAPELQVCARADKAGNVLRWAGAGEVESICAVTALATPAVESISELLELGDLEGYSFVGQKLALYVSTRPDGFVAAAGEPGKSPDTTTKKLATVAAVA